jgi:hypothetical protein
VSFWIHFGCRFGSILGSVLDPFWVVIWIHSGTHFGSIMGPILDTNSSTISAQICVSSKTFPCKRCAGWVFLRCLGYLARPAMGVHTILHPSQSSIRAHPPFRCARRHGVPFPGPRCDFGRLCAVLCAPDLDFEYTVGKMKPFLKPVLYMDSFGRCRGCPCFLTSGVMFFNVVGGGCLGQLRWRPARPRGPCHTLDGWMGGWHLTWHLTSGVEVVSVSFAEAKYFFLAQPLVQLHVRAHVQASLHPSLPLRKPSPPNQKRAFWASGTPMVGVLRTFNRKSPRNGVDV